MSETTYLKCADCKWASPSEPGYVMSCHNPKTVEIKEEKIPPSYHEGRGPMTKPVEKHRSCQELRQEPSPRAPTPNWLCGPDARYFEPREAGSDT